MDFVYNRIILEWDLIVMSMVKKKSTIRPLLDEWNEYNETIIKLTQFLGVE